MLVPPPVVLDPVSEEALTELGPERAVTADGAEDCIDCTDESRWDISLICETSMAVHSVSGSWGMARRNACEVGSPCGQREPAAVEPSQQTDTLPRPSEHLQWLQRWAAV